MGKSFGVILYASIIVANGNNKESMEKIEIAKILEWYNSGTLKTDEAVERIFSLFNVVGRSEQLVCECCEDNLVEQQGDWCNECLENPSRVITK